MMRAQFLWGLKWMAGARLGSQVVTWAITLLVMRLLAPADYGLLAMASVFVGFLLMMAEAGLWPALVQKRDLDESELAQVFGIVIAINLGFALLINAGAPLVARFFHEERVIDILRALSLQFVLTALGVIPGAQLNRKLKFRSLSLVNLLAAVSSSILTLMLAYLHFGVWALVFGTLFSGLLKAAALNALSPVRVCPRLSLVGMKRLLYFGGFVTGSRLLWFFFTQADVLVVGRILGQELLGLYSVAMHLASLPVQRVNSILNQVTFPVIARFQQDRENVAKFVVRALCGLSLIAFPILWGISSIASEIVEVALGAPWHDAVLPLRLLALTMPLRMLVSFLPSATDALGHPELGFWNSFWAAVLMPPAFVLGSRWGIAGVATAWVVVYPFVLLLNMRRMLAVIGVRHRDVVAVVLPAAISAGAMYVSVWGIGQVIADSGGRIERLTTLTAVGAAVYCLLTLILNRQGYRNMVSLLRGV
jgi:O-antigen/teichoic acid export membrane protein